MSLYWELGMTPEGFSHVCAQAVSRDDAPLGGAKAMIRCRRGTITLTADSDGRMQIPVSEALRAENPVISKGFGGSMSLSWYGGFTRADWKGRRVRLVSLDGTLRMGSSGLGVWYEDEGATAQAERALADLEEQHELIARVTGVEPVPWGLVLVDAPADSRLVVPSQACSPAWPCRLRELGSAEFARINTHEWTEQTVDTRLGLHDADPRGRNRFIVDGLADYVAFLHRGLPDDYDEPLKELSGAGVAHVDLLEEFRSIRAQGLHRVGVETVGDLLGKCGFPAGYPLSFVFWHRLCAEFGPELPSVFLEKMLGEKRRDADRALAILAEVTGRDTIRQSLKRADVEEAICVVEQLGSKRQGQEDRGPRP